MPVNGMAVRCHAMSKSTGKPCKAWAIKGGTTCRLHGGSAPQVKAKAAVRAELLSWGLTDQTIDPGETLLRLVSQSAMRCAAYASELEALVAESPSLREALIAETWIPTEHGDRYKAGEYIRGLAQLEAQERDRCASFSSKAVAAGLAMRQVALAEKQGQLMSEYVSVALKEAGIPTELAASFKMALARQVRQSILPTTVSGN